VTIEAPTPATACVIWLHGLGADGHDFEPIVPELGLPPGHGVRFVFPHAPIQPVTLNAGYAMRAWFDVSNPDLRVALDRAGIEAAAQAIRELIDDQVARGIPPAAIVLAGFSQGGVMALHIGTRTPEPLAGVVALSCFLADPARLPTMVTAAARSTPFFLAHGTVDSVIPFALGEEALTALTAAGIDVEWHDYGMAHGVCAEEVAHIGDFLRRVLGL
jgi:phospholipase/carboxylesterase